MSDEQLAMFLREELERIIRDDDLVTITISVKIFRRMAEIVIGNIQFIDFPFEGIMLEWEEELEEKME